MRRNSKAFEENLSIICDELHLAKQWGKASIILTIHKSTQSQDKTKKKLAVKLRGLGYSVVEVEIIKVKGNFIDFILEHDNHENIVFYVSNLDWGGGEDGKANYRILNLYRETLIEKKLKVVFFLTFQEAANLANYAPDFWAFRHYALEFRSPHPGNQEQVLPAGLLLWHIQKKATATANVEKELSRLKKTLAELPDHDESVALRVDLFYELGFLYWLLGNLPNAEKVLTKGWELAKTYDYLEALEKFQNGLAIINYEQGNQHDAMKLLESATNKNPQNCLLLINQAIVLFSMKKRYNAIEKGLKATKVCAQDSRVWNSLGFLYQSAGNMNNAITCFKRAIDLAPTVNSFYESLANCYLSMGLPEKAKAQLEQAKKRSGERDLSLKVLETCILGTPKDTVSLIIEAIQAGKTTKLDIMRDPILNALFESGNNALV